MNQIEDLVVRLRADLGIPDDVKPGGMDILRRLKFADIISAFEEVPDAQLDGREATWDPEKRTIFVSTTIWQRLTNEDDTEARFIILHEIGHVVLGHPARNRMKGGKEQFGRFIGTHEMEADDFAIVFAIPRAFVGTAQIQDVDTLSKQFGLPPSMAARRMIDLQKYARKHNRGTDNSTVEADSYAEAMSQMRINALNWNKL